METMRIIKFVDRDETVVLTSEVRDSDVHEFIDSMLMSIPVKVSARVFLPNGTPVFSVDKPEIAGIEL